MKTAIVVGTRPEVIKMAPVLHRLQELRQSFILIHSKQHYSRELDSVFFKELRLPQPDYDLNVGPEAAGHSRQIGGILIKIEPILEKEKPDVVLVQGDTNTVAAAALAASKMGIPVGHVEAGLRSYDRTMPEESNRIITDHLSDYLFAVTEVQREILLKEGIAPASIHVVGNTVTDALLRHLPLAEDSDVLERLGVDPGAYFLFTAHRSANVDFEPALRQVVGMLRALRESFSETVVWPLHPRTRKMLTQFGLRTPDGVITCEPLGYLDFVGLESRASVIITDSGGVQEEACILRVPCVTIRENTERPETLDVKANILVGRNREALVRAVSDSRRLDRQWENPFGDGKTAEAIVSVLEKSFGAPTRPCGQKVSVIGLGYMGLPTACLLATHGCQVSGVDIDTARVEVLNRGLCPFTEKGMDELLSDALKAGFQATNELTPSDAYIIAVPTPLKKRGCDLSFVIRAAETVAGVARKGDLVILESSVRPNTCKQVLQPIFEKAGCQVLVAHCPERALPGDTLHEIVHNDRVIGGLTEEAGDAAQRVYESFVRGRIHRTDATTAETAKLIENTFRDVNIALANELESIGRENDIDILEAMRLANQHPRVDVLRPGPGVGGHCLPIDPWFLSQNSPSAQLIPMAREINDRKPRIVAAIAARQVRLKQGRKVGVLGLAYKQGVDDCRESPALRVIDALRLDGLEVRAFDPYVKRLGGVELAGSLQELDEWADLLVLVTAHDEFLQAEFQTPLVDGFRLPHQREGSTVA